MKRLLACLVLCASLSASAQDDNCTVLGVQELSSLYSELSQSIDTITSALQGIVDQSNSNQSREITNYQITSAVDLRHIHAYVYPSGCNSCPNPTGCFQEWTSPAQDTVMSRISSGWTLLHQECAWKEESYYRINACQPNSGIAGGLRYYDHCMMSLTFVKYADD